MKLGLFLAALSAFAAEPDWSKLEPYAIDLLQRYIRIESVNPPADTRKTAELFKTELEKNGLAPSLYPSGPAGQTNLIVRIPGRDRTRKPLLLMNHFDVVPVDRKAWPVDPFGGILRGGLIWGRGAIDMKSIGVEHLTALIALKQAGITPSRDVVMLSTADEETNGVHGVRWMIQNHWPEIDAEYVLDEGGMATRDVLAPGRMVFGISVGEKQTAWLRLRARGTAGHASQPIPDNANLRLVTAIQRAMELPPATREHPVVAEMRRNIGEFAKNKFTAAIQRNTISLTTLNSGVGSPPKVNVIPSSAEATLDCRLLPGVNVQEFISGMKARINDPNVSVELISQPDDPGASDWHKPLFSRIGAAFRKYAPEATVTPMLVPYGTDSVKLRVKGMTAYGVTPMVLDTALMAGFHSDQERVPVEEVKRGVKVFYEVLRNIDD